MISHTAYKDVTPGYWWARYEGQNWSEKAIRQKQEWQLVKVEGNVPFLEVYTADPFHPQPMPLRHEGRSPEGSDVYIKFELIFYSRVDGPPQEDK